jgi:hypothetical protein
VLLLRKGSKKTLEIDDYRAKYINQVLMRLDIECTLPEILMNGATGGECFLISSIISTHIEANKIFEIKIGNDLYPVLRDDNLNKPKHLQPLALKNLAWLTEFCKFLTDAHHGVEIVREQKQYDYLG